MSKSIKWGGVLLLLLAVAGCQNASGSATPSTNQAGEQWLLGEEPEGAIGVLEARELASDAPLVLIGRIDGGKHEPWDEGRAAFFITDPTAAIPDHDHDGHDHDDCPYCSKRGGATSPRAIVQFLTPNGELIATDARELLGVKKNQLVVVRGTGRVDDLGNFVIAADGLYVRQ